MWRRNYFYLLNRVFYKSYFISVRTFIFIIMKTRFFCLSAFFLFKEVAKLWLLASIEVSKKRILLLMWSSWVKYRTEFSSKISLRFFYLVYVFHEDEYVLSILNINHRLGQIIKDYVFPTWIITLGGCFSLILNDWILSEYTSCIRGCWKILSLTHFPKSD